MRLREGGKLRALHANVCPLCVRLHGGATARFGQQLRQLPARWLIETDVRHNSIAEKSGDAAARAVEKLIGNQEFERMQILAQGADGAYGENAFDAERFH